MGRYKKMLKKINKGPQVYNYACMIISSANVSSRIARYKSRYNQLDSCSKLIISRRLKVSNYDLYLDICKE